MGNNQNSNRWVVYTIIAVLLIGLNVFMYFKTSNEKKAILADKSKVDSAYSQLERDYKRSIAEIEQYKGANAALDSLVQIKEAALKSKKEEIKLMLAKQNLDQQDLNLAIRKIADLKRENNRMLGTIDSFRRANEIIIEKLNTTQANLDESKKTNEHLNEENTRLTKVGSVLRIINVKASTGNDKGKKDKETDKARKADFIKINFDVAENKIANKGDKTMYYRIIGPTKNLIKDKKGSDNFSLAEGSDELQSSGKVNFDFDGSQASLSVKCHPKDKLNKGDYRVEFYSEGVLVGVSTFKLEGGLF